MMFDRIDRALSLIRLPAVRLTTALHTIASNRAAVPGRRRRRSCAPAAFCAMLALLLGAGKLSPLAGQASPGVHQQAGAGSPRHVTDALGNVFPAGARYGRIVSLAPSLTEEVFDLGRGDSIVADTTYCDYPAAAARKPKIGSMLAPDLEAVVARRPDLVLATIEGNRADSVYRLQAMHVPVFVAGRNYSFADIERHFRQLAMLLDANLQGDRIADTAAASIQRVRACIRGEAPVATFIEVGESPIVTTNGQTFLNEILTEAGGRNVFGALPTEWPRVSPEAVVAANPQAILISSGAGVGAQAAAEWRQFDLGAAKSGKLFIMDAHELATPTPSNFAAAVESAARLLHPESAQCLGKRNP
jgi:iron complex transport system substrate-binding protein